MTDTRAIIYSRPASDSQIAVCVDHAAANGWKVTEIITDSGVNPGKSAWARDGFTRAADLVTTGQADLILSVSADRITRRPTLDLPAINERGIRLETVQ
jgi:DNA invertase Pin-like site-specific DNA recombinase